jgi:hypothetical protein
MAHLISLSSVNIVHHVSAAKTLKAIHNIIAVPTVNDPSSIGKGCFYYLPTKNQLAASGRFLVGR